MAYWHMHLHPSNKDKWKYTTKDLLEKKSLIGIGDESTPKDLDKFNKIRLNDIIFIRDREKPIALVQVTGDFEDKGKDDYSMLDWFRYRRKIKILAMADSTTEDFPRSPTLLLQQSDRKNSNTYQYACVTGGSTVGTGIGDDSINISGCICNSGHIDTSDGDDTVNIDGGVCQRSSFIAKLRLFLL